MQLLGAEDAPLVKKPTDNLEAYNLVLQGRYYLMRSTAATLEKSVTCFTQALGLEPTYAQAQAGIAWGQAVLAVSGLAKPHTVMPLAKEAAFRALALDETLADAHAALAFVLYFYEWDWSGAERGFRRALELNPGDTVARGTYAVLLGQSGRADESVAEARAAVERDPLSLMKRYQLALVLTLARRYDAAMAEVHGGLELDASYHLFYQPLGWGLKRFSNRPCTTWGGRGTSARTDAGGPMRAYSMDLRERALLDSDAGMKAADVAAKYRVSGSWVRLLKQRRRDTGEVAPRVQRQGRRGMLEPHLHTLAALIAAHPDRTRAELKDALATPASVPTVWRAVRALGLTVTKNGPPVRTRSA